MQNLFTLLETRITPILSGRFWKLTVSAICVVYCIMTSLPNYLNLTEVGVKQSPYSALLLENYQALNNQTDHPFRPVEAGVSTHSSKLAFRFVPVLLINILPTDSLYVRMLGLYGINNLAGFLFFFSLITLTFRYSDSRFFSCLVAFNFCVLYVGKSFFHDTYLWNDGIAFAFLLLSLLSRNALVTLACLLAAYFTDERAIFGGVLVFVYHKLTGPDSGKQSALIPLSMRDFPFIFSVFGYAAIRMALMQFTDMQTPVGGNSGVSLFLRFQERFPLWINVVGLIGIYKVAWVLLFRSVGWLKRELFLLLCFVFGVISLIVISLSVEDLTRSLAYSFMALTSAFFLYYRHSTRSENGNPEYGAFQFLILNACIPTISVVLYYFKLLPPIDRLIARFL